MYCVSVLINKILKTETCQLALWSLVSTWCKIKMLHQRNSIVLHKQCKLGISIQFDIQMGPLPPILLGKRRELQECTNISSEDGGGHTPTHPPTHPSTWLQFFLALAMFIIYILYQTMQYQASLSLWSEREQSHRHANVLAEDATVNTEQSFSKEDELLRSIQEIPQWTTFF